MRSIPIYDETAPIACTIGEHEIGDRIELVERLRTNLSGIDRTDTGLLLRFPARPDIDRDVRRFAVDEKACCRFWGFAIDTDRTGLTLRWDAPPAADELVDRLLSYFRGDQPLTAISGLL